MKILKILVGILLFVFLGWIVLCLVSPSKLIVEREQVIDCPVSDLFEQVNNYENWKTWSPWHLQDPDMKITYSNDKTVGLGAKYNWDSEVLGQGYSEIVESIPNKKIKTALFFGFGDINHASFEFSPDGNKTIIKWSMDGAQSPFFMKGMNTIMQPQVEKDYEVGLNNLAGVCK